MRLQRMAAVAAGMALAATAAMSLTAQADPEPGPPWGAGQIYIIKYNIAFCLTVPKSDQRASLVMQRCTGESGQDWITTIKDNHLVIEWSGNTSLCVGSKLKSTAVTLVNCVGTTEDKELTLSLLRYREVGETEHKEPIAQVHPYNGQLMSAQIRKPQKSKSITYPVAFNSGSERDHNFIFPPWHLDENVDK